MNVIAEMQMPPLSRGGVPIVCPVCGQHDDLTLVIDSQDFSESASLMRCDGGHQWAEPLLPRRLGAELLASKVRNNPGMIDWSAVGGPPDPSTLPTHGVRRPGGRFRRRRRRP